MKNQLQSIGLDLDIVLWVSYGKGRGDSHATLVHTVVQTLNSPVAGRVLRQRDGFVVEHLCDGAHPVCSTVVVEAPVSVVLAEGVPPLARDVLVGRRHLLSQGHHFVKVLNILFHIELIPHIDDILVLLW